jgi:hypothetical protein
LSAQDPTSENDGNDDTIECPQYKSKQVHEALEILQGYSMQKGDDNGKARKAIDAYRGYFSVKVIQAQYQTRLPKFFARREQLQNLVNKVNDTKAHDKDSINYACCFSVVEPGLH